MDKKNIQNEIDALQEAIRTYEEIMNDENREELQKRIDDAKNKIAELNAQQEAMDKKEDEELEKVVSDNAEYYKKQIVLNLQESKEISDLIVKNRDLSTDELSMYRERIEFLGEQNRNLAVLVSNNEEITKLKNNKKMPKGERIKKIVECKKAISTTKKEMKKSGSVGEVASSVFGQVNRRITNILYKNGRMYQNACKRCESLGALGSYASWRLPLGLFFGVGGLLMGGVGMPGAVIGLGYTALVGSKSIAALTRIITKTDMTQIKNRPISKLSWLSNIKNSIYKFGKARGLNNITTQNAPKKEEPKKESVSKDKTDDTKEKYNVDLNRLKNKLKEIAKVDSTGNLEINLEKVDYKNYNVLKLLVDKFIETYGEDKLPQNIKDFYKKYVNLYNNNYSKCLKAFVDSVNELDINTVNDVKMAKCNYFYKMLNETFNGLDKVEKDVLGKYMLCLEKCTKKTTKEEDKVKEEVKDDKLVYDQKDKDLLYEVSTFKLEPTLESCEKCQELISKLFKLDANRRKKFHAVSTAYEKFIYLRNNLDSMKKVATFIELVNKFDFKDEVKFNEQDLRKCYSIYEKLNKEEIKLVPNTVINKYKTALNYDLVLTLRMKLEELDIDKCVSDRNFAPINECVELSNKLVNYTEGNVQVHKSTGDEQANVSQKRITEIKKSAQKFPRELLEKIAISDHIMEELNKYKDSQLYIELVVDNKMKTYAKCSLDVNGTTEDKIIYVDDIRDNQEQIIYRIIENNPFINESNIHFVNEEIKQTVR